MRGLEHVHFKVAKLEARQRGGRPFAGHHLHHLAGQLREHTKLVIPRRGPVHVPQRVRLLGLSHAGCIALFRGARFQTYDDCDSQPRGDHMATDARAEG